MGFHFDLIGEKDSFLMWVLIFDVDIVTWVIGCGELWMSQGFRFDLRGKKDSCLMWVMIFDIGIVTWVIGCREL